MSDKSATSVAHPNIALIKYWGDLDTDLHIPANGSISMNLNSLSTRTYVRFDSTLDQDQFTLNGAQINRSGWDRVVTLLSRVREMAGIDLFAKVESENNFPTGSGIASSASGFAALSLAATAAAGLDLDEKALSRLARTGSGSACRSIPSGFVEWQAGKGDLDSYAYSLYPPDHWDLADCIIVVSQSEKAVSSKIGHTLANTSSLQQARVSDAPRRLKMCKDALVNRDFDQLSIVVELDSNMMHAIMLTSKPPLMYWQPETLDLMHGIESLRKAGTPVCYTVDAGPNVHALCQKDVAADIVRKMKQYPGVFDVIISVPGGPAKLINP